MAKKRIQRQAAPATTALPASPLPDTTDLAAVLAFPTPDNERETQGENKDELDGQGESLAIATLIIKDFLSDPPTPITGESWAPTSRDRFGETRVYLPDGVYAPDGLDWEMEVIEGRISLFKMSETALSKNSEALTVAANTPA